MIDLPALIFPALVGLGFSWLATSVYGAARKLWVISAAVIAIGLVIGVSDWQNQSSRETPLHTYILLAVAPVVLCSLVIWSLRAKGLHRTLVIGAATAVYLITSILSLYTGFFL